jgi:hypothetical protein
MTIACDVRRHSPPTRYSPFKVLYAEKTVHTTKRVIPLQ